MSALQTNQARPVETAGPPLILCFGDSLTAGLGLPPSESYPEVLLRDLRSRGYRYRVVNLGRSGETSGEGLARLDRALALRPAIVVLEFGANDGFRGVPLPTIEANLGSMIEAFQRGGARVALAGIRLPDYLPEYTRRFNSMYPELAAKYGVTLIPSIVEGVLGNPAYVQPDGLHPNAEGARRIAETVFEALKPLLK